MFSFNKVIKARCLRCKLDLYMAWIITLKSNLSRCHWNEKGKVRKHPRESGWCEGCNKTILYADPPLCLWGERCAIYPSHLDRQPDWDLSLLGGENKNELSPMGGALVTSVFPCTDEWLPARNTPHPKATRINCPYLLSQNLELITKQQPGKGSHRLKAWVLYICLHGNFPVGIQPIHWSEKDLYIIVLLRYIKGYCFKFMPLTRVVIELESAMSICSLKYTSGRKPAILLSCCRIYQRVTRQ